MFFLGNDVYCNSCGAIQEGDDEVCRECAKALFSSSNSQRSPSGFGGFDADQPQSDNHASTRHDRRAGDIGRLAVTPVTLRGLPFKVNWLIAFGILIVLASIFGLAKVVSSGWWFVLFGVGAFFYAVGSLLKRKRFLWLSTKNSFEVNARGEIFLTKIAGQCPVCEGKLKLIDIGAKKSNTTAVRCTLNPEHSWSFDPDLLGDL